MNPSGRGGGGEHRGEIITTETQRTRSSDPEWEMVLSFCILDFSVTPCSLCLCGNNFFSVSSFSLRALPPRLTSVMTLTIARDLVHRLVGGRRPDAPQRLS